MINTFELYYPNKSNKTNHSYQIKELPKYLTQEEVKKFFSTIKDKRDRALFATVYRYGLRVSEVTLISPRDISWERNRIYIRRVKNGISAERRLFSDVKRLIKAYLKERKPTGTALFTGKQGNLKLDIYPFQAVCTKGETRPSLFRPLPAPFLRSTHDGSGRGYKRDAGFLRYCEVIMLN